MIARLRSWLATHQDSLILGLLVAGVALRTLLALASPTPFGYVWDLYHEGVRVLAVGGRLPIAEDCWQCYHPPLFYLVGWPFYLAGHLIDAPGSETWALRATAALALPASAIVTYYGYRLLRLFGCRGGSLVGGLALLLVMPVLFMSSYGAEADIVLAALFTAFIYHLTRYAAHPSAARAVDVALIGLLAGLSMATKYNGLVALATAGAVFAIQLARGPARWRTCAHGAFVFVIAVSIGGWKYWDNVQRYGHPLHANGSAAEGLSLGARTSGAPYEFTTMRIGDAIGLFGLTAPAGDLTTQPVYQSVPTSLHALTWTDMSFFSHRSRHGLPDDPYPHKRIPRVLLGAMLVLGFVPELLALVGVCVTLRRRAWWPSAIFAFITLSAYFWWLLPQESWALKPKYVLGLLAPVVLYAMVGQGWLARRVPWIGLTSAVLLVALVVVAHLYLYVFAVGRF